MPQFVAVHCNPQEAGEEKVMQENSDDLASDFVVYLIDSDNENDVSNDEVYQ